MTRYGDALEISNSEIQSFSDCRRRWWLSYYRGLKPKTERPVGPMSIGRRVHLALETGYSTPGREDAARAVLAASIEQEYPLAESTGLLKEFESDAELCLIMLEGFFDWAAEEGLDAEWEVVASERIVKAPPLEIAGDLVILKGKLDQTVRRLMDDVLFMRDWKGQPLDGVVHTPQGPRQMQDISVGDYVVGGDGRPTIVTATQDLGAVPCYVVSFSDGASLEVTSEHLWRLLGNGRRPGGLLSTEEMFRMGVDDITNVAQPTKRWSIPVVEPILQAPLNLPIDPYLLGLFLGDGHFRVNSHRASIASADDEILTYTERFCKYPRKSDSRSSCYSVSLNEETRSALMALGLEGHLSYTKFIPPMYFGGSRNQRMALLRGLMDTDGSCQKTGRRPNAQSSFATTSPYLRDGVIRLVRSLGGLAQYGSTLVGRIDGEAKADYWAVTISMSTCPFRLRRKAVVWTPVRVQRKVVGVEPSGTKLAKCIKVEAADGLYVAGWDYIVTHNTTATMTPVMLAFRPQLKTYLLLLALTEPMAQVSGGQFIFLKRVKRTVRANPPFYSVEPLYVGPKEMESFWISTIGTLERMVEATAKLDAGADHREVAPPRPTRDCSWRCPFYTSCEMFDDGSDVERYLDANYVIGDPYEYYGLDDKDKETET